MTYRILAVLLSGLFAFPSLAQDLPVRWSLQECVEHALTNNISVQQARLRSQSALNNLSTARWDYAPNLSAGANYFWNFGLNIDPVTNLISQQTRQTANFTLSTNWNVYNGGRKYTAIERNKLDAQAARMDYEAARNDISLNVASGFLQILLNKEIAAVAAEQVRISQLQVNRMAKMVQAGTVPQGDLLQLEAQLANDQQNLIRTQNAVRIARLQLANLLQLEDPDQFDITEPQLNLPTAELISASPAPIYQGAVDDQPVIKAAELRLMSSEKQVREAQANYLPSLSFIAQVGSNYSDQIQTIDGFDQQVVPIGVVENTGQVVNSVQLTPNFAGVKPFNNQFEDNLNEVVGINFTVPIFNRMAVRNAVQNAKINQDIARLNLEQNKNTLRQTIYQAHADAKAAFEQYQAAQKSLKANQEAFDYAQKRFEVGALNQVDFENAKNNLAAAQSQLIQGKYDFIFRIKVLEFYLNNQISL